MRGLLWLLRKYNYVLVFIALEVIAILLLSNHNLYQHSILINVHREISGSLFDRIGESREYLYLKKSNGILVRENALLRNKLEQLKLSDSATAAGEAAVGSYFYTPAHVVQSSHNKQFNYITIDRGTKQGISSNMSVIGDEGIVGIVLASSSNYSTIIPIINRDFRLSVKIKNNNFAGILEWDGKDHKEAILNEIPFHAEVNPGDTIVTSGFSAIFPEGLYVGTVKEFSLQEGNFFYIVVDLGVDYQRLFDVYVIKNFHQQEQLDLESKLNE